MGHEPAHPEFVHRCQMESVQGSHVRPFPLMVLAGCGLEDAARQRANRKRLPLLQTAQPFGKPAILAPGHGATEPSGAQLDFGLQLRQDAKDDEILPNRGAPSAKAALSPRCRDGPLSRGETAS